MELAVVLLLGDFFVKSAASLASGATKGVGVQLSLRKADMEGVVNCGEWLIKWCRR